MATTPTPMMPAHLMDRKSRGFHPDFLDHLRQLGSYIDERSELATMSLNIDYLTSDIGKSHMDNRIILARDRPNGDAYGVNMVYQTWTKISIGLLLPLKNKHMYMMEAYVCWREDDGTLKELYFKDSSSIRHSTGNYFERWITMDLHYYWVERKAIIQLTISDMDERIMLKHLNDKRLNFKCSCPFPRNFVVDNASEKLCMTIPASPPAATTRASTPSTGEIQANG